MGWPGAMTHRQWKLWQRWLPEMFPDRFVLTVKKQRTEAERNRDLKNRSAQARAAFFGASAKLTGKGGKIYDVDGRLIGG